MKKIISYALILIILFPALFGFPCVSYAGGIQISTFSSLDFKPGAGFEIVPLSGTEKLSDGRYYIASGNGVDVCLRGDNVQNSKNGAVILETEFVISESVSPDTEYSMIRAVPSGVGVSSTEPILRTLPVSHSKFPAAVQFYGKYRSDSQFTYSSLAGAKVKLKTFFDVSANKTTTHCRITEADGKTNVYHTSPATAMSEFLDFKSNGFDKVRLTLPQGSVVECVKLSVAANYSDSLYFNFGALEFSPVGCTQNPGKIRDILASACREGEFSFGSYAESGDEIPDSVANALLDYVLDNDYASDAAIQYVYNGIVAPSVRVYLNQDCNTGFHNSERVNKSVYAKSVYLDDEKKNGAILFKKSGYTQSGVIVEHEIAMSGKIVLECDINITDVQDAKAHIFLMHGSDGTYSRNLCVTSDGALVCGKKQTAIGYIPLGEWVTLKAAMDFESGTLDLWVGDEVVYSDIEFHRPISDTVGWTIGWIGGDEGGDSTGILIADNLRAYEAIEPLDISNANKIYAYNADIMANGEKLLEKSVAFCEESQSVWSDGNKQKISGSIIIRKEEIYVKTSVLKGAFGSSDEPSDDMCIIVGNDKYASAEKYASALGFKCTTDISRKLFLASDDEADVNSDAWLDASDIMRYDLESPLEILKHFDSVNPVHPRIMVNDEKIRKMHTMYRTDDEFKAWSDYVLGLADDIVDEPCISYDESADSKNILYKSRTVSERILTLGVAYFITQDEIYANRAIAEMKAACEFPSWNTYYHYLDASEMGSAVSIGYDWFWNILDADEKNYFENKIYSHLVCQSRKAFEGSGSGESTFWIAGDDNWNIVCSSGSVVSACAIFDAYPDECASLISYALNSLAVAERSAWPDGGWEEGSDYTVYLMKYFSFMISALNSTLNTDMNLTSGLDNIADYMLAIDGQTGCFNFHDSHYCATHTTSDIMSMISDVFSRPELFKARKMAIDSFKLMPGAIDLLYYMQGVQELDIPLDYHAKPIEVFAMRNEFYNSDGVYAAIQGGKGWTGHSHLDGGTFTVDINGERWATNLGQDSYDLPGYFGSVETRYSYYRNRPESANVYVINPRVGSFGQNVDADVKIIAQASYDDEACAVMNLTEAYIDDAIKAYRGIKLCDRRSSVVIRDEITLPEGDNEIYWFMNVPKTSVLTRLDNNRYKLSKANGASIELHIETGGISDLFVDLLPCVPLNSSPDPEGQDKNRSLEKLTIRGIADKECFINVRFTNSGTFKSDEALENWRCFEFEAETDGVVFEENDCGECVVSADVRARSVCEPKRVALVVGHYSGDKLNFIDADFVTLSGVDTKKLIINTIRAENETLKAFVIDESIRPVGSNVD